MNSTNLKPNSRFLGKMITIITLIALPIVLFGVFVGGLIRMDGGPGGTFTLVTIVIAALGWLIATMFAGPYYNSLSYEIQDDEVIVHAGIVTKSVKHVPYRTVTNIKIKRGLLDRFVFNIGTLNIQTAGMSGNTGAEESLVGLENVHEIYDQVVAKLREFRGAMSPNASDVEPSGAGSSVSLADLLEELQAIRRSLDK